MIVIEDGVRQHKALLAINHRHREFKNKQINHSFNVDKEIFSLSDYKKAI